MMDKIKVCLYRHKYFEDLFLARNWNYCGGTKDTPFYFATKDVVRAISDAQNPKFRDWMNSFEGSLTVKFTDKKEVDIEGYHGMVEKELKFPIEEFVPVELVEV